MSAKSRQTTRKNAVIVEIGKDWLKVIEGEPTRRGIAVARLHLERIEEDDPNVAEALRDAIRDLKFTSQPVILCLPRDVVTVRVVRLPSTDAAEIGDMVDLQVGKQTPYSRDEILWGYRVIGTAPEGYARVMLAIAQRAVVRHRVNVVEEAGLDVAAVSISTEGVLNWISDAGHDAASGRAVVVADVDSACTDVCVSVGGSLVFSRSLRIGAGQLRAEGGTWVERFVAEIGHTLDACKSEVPGLEIERVILTGAGTSVDGLSAALGTRLGVPCEPVDSLQQVDRMPRTPSLSDPLYSSVSLTAAVGLVRHASNLVFNLMPDSVIMRRRLMDKSRVMTTFGMLLMASLVALSFLAASKLVFRQGRLRYLQERLLETDARAQEVERKKEVIKLVRREQDERRSSVNIFAEAQRARPADVFYEKVDMDIERGRLTLSGSAGTLADVRSLVNNLKELPLFVDVKPGGTTLDTSGRYTFQVVCAMEESR